MDYSRPHIAKKDLVAGTYYRGKCRNSTVAVWSGTEFWYMRNKWNYIFPEAIHAPEDDEVYDVFFAEEPVTPLPEEIVDMLSPRVVGKK